jgi:predicted phage tail protein
MPKTVKAPAEKRRRRPSVARVSGAKGGSQKPHTPYKAPDSALSIATVKLLYALSEGPIVGPVDDKKSVKLNGTPLISPDGSENFPGTVWDFRPGTVDQEHIAGFPAIENEASQGLPVELKSDNAWTRAITDQQLSAIRVRLSWPQIWQLKTNGDQIGYRIDYAIDLSVDGGSYQTVLSATLNDKGTTEYERTHRIDLPEGFTSALVRVRRLTPNRNDSNFADLMRIKGLTEVIDKKLRYPNLALGGLQFDAKQFQDTPKASFLMRGRIVQVPTNYDPQSRTYTGTWNGTFKLAYTNNPVWVWRDLLLHRRYGLGRRITADMVDHWTLYEIGRYCDVMVPDGKGGLQPRMTTNVYIQDSIEGYALLSDLASVFRGSSCWNGSQVTMVADIPGNEDGYVFTRSNIIGEFEYVAAAYPDRHTRAKVAWDNPENEFKTQPAPVTNEELIGALGHRMLDISRFGCTVEGEAIRHGIWVLKSEQYEEWSVSFTTGMEGRNVEPGQIICVADETFTGRPNGGRISAATKRVITLDIDAPVQQEDRLILNLPSGKSEGRIVKSVSGRLVTVMADYSELPEPECSWSVESADLAVMRFRVQTIEPQGLHQFKISATQHEPQKYAAIDTGARIDPQPISIIPPGVMAPPVNITLAARSVVSQGIAVTSMRITWESVPGAIAYNVEWRKDSGNWIRLPRTGSLGAEVEGIYSGRYVARVSSVNAMDVASIWGISPEVTLTGKTGLPPSVTHLTTSSELFAIGLKWGFPAGAEDTQRTEIWYSPANSLEGATKLSDLAYPQSDYKLQGLAAGASFFFWARLVDRTGNIGPWYPATNGVLGQSSSDAGPILDLISGQITESELGQELLKEIEKISGDFPGSVNDRIDSAKQELEDLISEITDPLEYVPTNAYLKNDSVRNGQRLYMAIAPVPAAANGNNAPPNPTYWVDIGSIAETANGLAQAVAKNTTDITTIDGKVTAQASMIQAVQSSARDDNCEGDLADALRGWDTSAKVAEESRTRATQNEAMATRMVAVESRVDENTASTRSLEKTVATNESATASRFADVATKVGENSANISQLDKTVTDNESSTASRLTQVNSRVDATDGALAQEKADREAAISGERLLREAAISDEARTRVAGDEALGERIGHMEASFVSPQGERDDNGEGDLAGALKSWESTAKIAEESKVRATAIEAQARKSETLEASFNSSLDKTNGEIQKTNASIQTTTQALAALDGKASTMWAVKMQVNSQGQYVAASVGMGIENGPGGLQSTFLVSADTFAVVNGINGTLASPFAVTGGQVFMNSAFIMDGTITNAKIGSYISSTNYVAGQQGWILNKNGTLEINGMVAGQGRLTITNQRVRIYHANGNLAIDLGVNV